MSKHTPGPWFKLFTPSHVAGEDGHLCVVDSQNWIVVGWDRPLVSEEDMANAQVIAAAPQMLEALKTASLALDHAGVWGTRDVIDLVIQAAEGGDETDA